MNGVRVELPLNKKSWRDGWEEIGWERFDLGCNILCCAKFVCASFCSLVINKFDATKDRARPSKDTRNFVKIFFQSFYIKI